MSTIIQQMVTRGLVTREVDPRDRRAVSLHLTDQGRVTLERWMRANQERVSAAMAMLTTEELGAIEEAIPAMTVLVQNLENAAHAD